MSEATSLPKQTVTLNNGKELSRVVFDVAMTASGNQTGRIWLNGEKVLVFRDQRETLIWREDSKLPDIDEPINSTEHDDRCSCPACFGLCQDDYEFYSGTGRYSSK